MRIIGAATLHSLSLFIFGVLLPMEEVKKYDKVIFGQKLTVRDRFISYFEQREKIPKYSQEISKIIVMEIAEKVLLNQERFLNFEEKEDGSYYFDFSVFDPLMVKVDFFSGKKLVQP